MMAGIGILTMLLIVRLYDPVTKLDVECNCECNSSIECPTEPVGSIDITCEPTFFGIADTFTNKNMQAAHSEFDWEKIVYTVDDHGELYGSSMEPTFFDGNTALSKKITSDYKLKIGELLRYRLTPTPGCQFDADINMESRLGEYSIHRINAIYGEDEIMMVADNAQTMDVIKRCQITHIVVGVLYT